MSELFSNNRLIDYFILLETKITSVIEVEKSGINLTTSLNNHNNINNFNFNSDSNTIDQEQDSAKFKEKNYTSNIKTNEKDDKNKVNTSNSDLLLTFDKLKVECKYQIIQQLPESQYKNPYELNLESIFLMLPNEHIYTVTGYSVNTKEENNTLKNKENYYKHNSFNGKLTKTSKSSILNKNKEKDAYSKSNSSNIEKMNIFTSFFSMCYTNVHGGYYYGHFLKVLEEEFVPAINNTALIPKYLVFFSTNPFFVSFKTLLEEIYINSITNFNFNFKNENLLSTILYRAFLPKYQHTQLSFNLLSNNFNFTNNKFHTEISLRLLFTYLSPDRVVLLFITLLMNCKIIFFHSQIEILCPIIVSLMSLIHPLSLGYNIICNLNPLLVDIIETPSSNLIIGINKNEFGKSELEEIFLKIHSNTIDLVYCDLDSNVVEISYHEEIRKPNLLPIDLITELVHKLNSIAGCYDSEIKCLLKETCDNIITFGYKEVVVTPDFVYLTNEKNIANIQLLTQENTNSSMNFLNNITNIDGITNNLIWEYASAFKLNDINEIFMSSGIKNNIYNGGNCLISQINQQKSTNKLVNNNNNVHITSNNTIEKSFNPGISNTNFKKKIPNLLFNYYNKMNNCLTNETEIKACILQFTLTLFEAYNENKHFEIESQIEKEKSKKRHTHYPNTSKRNLSTVTHPNTINRDNTTNYNELSNQLSQIKEKERDRDREKMDRDRLQEDDYNKTFNAIKFIEDSKKELQPFLFHVYRNNTFDFFIQNLNHIVDSAYKKGLLSKGIITKIFMNRKIKESSLIENFFSNHYTIFIKGLMCNTNSNTKSGLVSLIRLEERIFHTITISAVTSFTKNGLPYTQSSIFNDEMNRKELFLEESIDYSVSELVNYSKSKNSEKKDKNEFKSGKNDNYNTNNNDFFGVNLRSISNLLTYSVNSIKDFFKSCFTIPLLDLTCQDSNNKSFLTDYKGISNLSNLSNVNSKDQPENKVKFNIDLRGIAEIASFKEKSSKNSVVNISCEENQSYYNIKLFLVANSLVNEFKKIIFGFKNVLATFYGIQTNNSIHNNNLKRKNSNYNNRNNEDKSGNNTNINTILNLNNKNTTNSYNIDDGIIAKSKIDDTIRTNLNNTKEIKDFKTINITSNKNNTNNNNTNSNVLGNNMTSSFNPIKQRLPNKSETTKTNIDKLKLDGISATETLIKNSNYRGSANIVSNSKDKNINEQSFSNINSQSNYNHNTNMYSNKNQYENNYNSNYSNNFLSCKIKKSKHAYLRDLHTILTANISNINNNDNSTINKDQVTHRTLHSASSSENITGRSNEHKDADNYTKEVDNEKNKKKLDSINSYPENGQIALYTSFSPNTIQTCSYCLNCKRIYSLWEIRALLQQSANLYNDLNEEYDVHKQCNKSNLKFNSTTNTNSYQFPYQPNNSVYAGNNNNITNYSSISKKILGVHSPFKNTNPGSNIHNISSNSNKIICNRCSFSFTPVFLVIDYFNNPFLSIPCDMCSINVVNNNDNLNINDFNMLNPTSAKLVNNNKLENQEKVLNNNNNNNNKINEENELAKPFFTVNNNNFVFFDKFLNSFHDHCFFSYKRVEYIDFEQIFSSLVSVSLEESHSISNHYRASGSFIIGSNNYMNNKLESIYNQSILLKDSVNKNITTVNSNDNNNLKIRDNKDSYTKDKIKDSKFKDNNIKDREKQKDINLLDDCGNSNLNPTINSNINLPKNDALIKVSRQNVNLFYNILILLGEFKVKAVKHSYKSLLQENLFPENIKLELVNNLNESSHLGQNNNTTNLSHLLSSTTLTKMINNQTIEKYKSVFNYLTSLSESDNIVIVESYNVFEYINNFGLQTKDLVSKCLSNIDNNQTVNINKNKDNIGKSKQIRINSSMKEKNTTGKFTFNNSHTKNINNNANINNNISKNPTKSTATIVSFNKDKIEKNKKNNNKNKPKINFLTKTFTTQSNKSTAQGNLKFNNNDYTASNRTRHNLTSGGYKFNEMNHLSQENTEESSKKIYFKNENFKNNFIVKLNCKSLIDEEEYQNLESAIEHLPKNLKSNIKENLAEMVYIESKNKARLKYKIDYYSQKFANNNLELFSTKNIDTDDENQINNHNKTKSKAKILDYTDSNAKFNITNTPNLYHSCSDEEYNLNENEYDYLLNLKGSDFNYNFYNKKLMEKEQEILKHPEKYSKEYFQLVSLKSEKKHKNNSKSIRKSANYTITNTNNNKAPIIKNFKEGLGVSNTNDYVNNLQEYKPNMNSRNNQITMNTRNNKSGLLTNINLNDSSDENAGNLYNSNSVNEDFFGQSQIQNVNTLSANNRILMNQRSRVDGYSLDSNAKQSQLEFSKLKIQHEKGNYENDTTLQTVKNDDLLKNDLENEEDIENFILKKNENLKVKAAKKEKDEIKTEFIKKVKASNINVLETSKGNFNFKNLIGDIVNIGNPKYKPSIFKKQDTTGKHLSQNRSKIYDVTATWGVNDSTEKSGKDTVSYPVKDILSYNNSNNVNNNNLNTYQKEYLKSNETNNNRYAGKNEVKLNKNKSSNYFENDAVANANNLSYNSDNEDELYKYYHDDDYSNNYKIDYKHENTNNSSNKQVDNFNNKTNKNIYDSGKFNSYFNNQPKDSKKDNFTEQTYNKQATKIKKVNFARGITLDKPKGREDKGNNNHSNNEELERKNKISLYMEGQPAEEFEDDEVDEENYSNYDNEKNVSNTFNPRHKLMNSKEYNEISKKNLNLTKKEQLKQNSKNDKYKNFINNLNKK